MHKLLYYPDFEIQDENFLKFALLYVDEIRPIIPYNAMESLSETMHNIINNTDLINPYSPSYENGYLASIAAIEHLEERVSSDRYSYVSSKIKPASYDYTLYSEKYTNTFENYCLENGLGQRCDEGILLNTDTAYAYMSILAEIISKETEIDMITDIVKYSDPYLRYPAHINRKSRERLDIIQKEIQFYVPVDMYRIPLEAFVNLRSNSEFEIARRNFVAELNAVLDSYDKNASEVDLNNFMECKQEIYGILKELFISCAAVAVGVHSLGNMCLAEKGTLAFWENVGNVGISLDTLKQHYHAAREYAVKIERKRQARKYLAKLKQLRTEVL